MDENWILHDIYMNMAISVRAARDEKDFRVSVEIVLQCLYLATSYIS